MKPAFHPDRQFSRNENIASLYPRPGETGSE
jgi:hypothetical protein